MILADAITGFYAVLVRDDEALARMLLASGARVLQLRMKGATAGAVVRAAKMARRLCDEAGAGLIINDRVDVARVVDANGVHLGQTDLPIGAAREQLGAHVWIGVSTHNVDQVHAAVSAGADYLGFGPIFATSTKANPDPVQGIEGLRAAVAAAGAVPIVAIGGLTAQHAGALYAAGASALCAISAVNGASDVTAAGRLFARG